MNTDEIKSVSPHGSNTMLAEVKCRKGELPKSGHVYFIALYTAPKVFNGLYFECLLTNQKIPAYAKLIEDLGNIHDYKSEIWKPERFGLNSR